MFVYASKTIFETCFYHPLCPARLCALCVKINHMVFLLAFAGKAHSGGQHLMGSEWRDRHSSRHGGTGHLGATGCQSSDIQDCSGGMHSDICPISHILMYPLIHCNYRISVSVVSSLCYCRLVHCLNQYFCAPFHFFSTNLCQLTLPHFAYAASATLTHKKTVSHLIIPQYSHTEFRALFSLPLSSPISISIGTLLPSLPSSAV